jgi:hypothetical protein
LAEVAVDNIESSPIYTPEPTTRRLLAGAPDYRASNANDGDPETYTLTQPGVGVFWSGDLQTDFTEMKVSQVKLRNAPAPADASRFTAYRVVIESDNGDKICGVTKDVVAAGEQVIVTCGTEPNYISGKRVRVETTTNVSLQLAEVEVVGTDGSEKSKQEAIKNNALQPCTSQGFNSCYNKRAIARHNDYREGHQFTSPLEVTPPLVGDDALAKKLQDWLTAQDYSIVDKDTIKADILDDTPDTCSTNIYIEDDDSKIEALERSDAATDAWYLNGY